MPAFGQRTFLAACVRYLDNNFKLRVISAYFLCRTDTIVLKAAAKMTVVRCAKGADIAAGEGYGKGDP